MKYLTCRYLTIGLIGLLISLMGSFAEAQTLGSLHIPSNQQKDLTIEKGKDLKDGLKQLEGYLDVVFLYQSDVVENKKVLTTKQLSNDVKAKDAIEILLEGHQLIYKYLNPKTYGIYTPKEAPQQPLIQDVSGTVTDSSSGEPLPGVNVLVKGTSTGTSTDANGEYELTVESLQDTLAYSFIGYQMQEVPIRGRTNIDVTLQSQAIMGEELVVTGYSTESQFESTGSISSIDTSGTQDIPAQNAGSVLQGRAAGVQVSSTSGNPGSGFQVQVRGNGSITAGTEPLYIVDGVSINTSNQSDLVQGSPLNKINPSDIESIQVLKDAASAAIYGAEGANGVVIITTKQGQQGATKISANIESGVRTNINTYDLVNSQEYLRYYQQALNYSDQQILDYGNSFGYAYEGNPYSSIEDFPTFDWQDYIYETGAHQAYNIDLSGGNEKTQFYISGSYDKTEGTVRGSNFDQYTLNTSINQQVSEKLTTKLKINLANSNQFGVCQGGRSTGCPVSNSAFQPPVAPAFLANGEYNTQTLFGATSNQARLLENETRKSSDVSIFGNASATYNFTDWLSLRGFFGLDWENSDNKQFTSIALAPTTNGSIYERTRNIFNFKINALLRFDNSYSDVHNINGFVATEYQRNYNSQLGATATNLNTDLLRILNAGAVANNAYGTNTEYRIASYFGNFKYNYDRRYLFSFTGRYDGSSRFGENNRWAFFPSVSLGWRISEEDFINTDFVNNLKLRASYGTTGNAQIGNFTSLGTYEISGSYLDENSLAPTRLANQSLTWEVVQSLNVGLDYGLLNNRLRGTIDVYRRNNKDLLLNRPLPLDSGFESVLENVGAVRNDGIEFSVQGALIQQGEFELEHRLNLSIERNTVTKLSSVQDQLNADLLPVASGQYHIPVAVGHSIRSWWVPEWAGVNPADGRPMWYDENGNITYNPSLEDRIFFDSGDQDAYGGFGTTLSYKGLSIDAFFQWSYGKTATPGTITSFLHTSSFNGVVNEDVLDSWSYPGQVTDLPRPEPGDTPDGSSKWRELGSGTAALYSADYIRFKTLKLNYNFPTTISDNLNLRGLQVYISANNIHTWTNWPGLEPDFDGNAYYAEYPQARQINGGINIKF